MTKPPEQAGFEAGLMLAQAVIRVHPKMWIFLVEHFKTCTGCPLEGQESNE